MLNSLEEYKEVMHCYYNVLDNIDRINMYSSEIRLVLEKISNISKSDIYAAYELYSKLSYDLKNEFIMLYGDVFEICEARTNRYSEDLEMIKKYDQRRAERILKK